MRSAALALALLIPASAAAKSERTDRHTYGQTWPTAIRHLRIDEGFEIVEKDADTGYVVFATLHSGKKYPGSLQIIQTKDSEGRAILQLKLTIDSRPTYEEDGVLDRLLAKLDSEHGEDDEPESEPEPEPEPDPKD